MTLVVFSKGIRSFLVKWPLLIQKKRCSRTDATLIINRVTIIDEYIFLILGYVECRVWLNE